jgi:fatty-acyl-CoA synthase
MFIEAPNVAHIKGDTNTEILALTVGELLHRSAQHIPDQAALIVPATAGGDPEIRLNYRELETVAQRAAHALLRHFSPGDRLATWASGGPEIIELQLGAALAGLVLVTLNPANRGGEIEYMLSQSKAKGLFLSREFRGMDNEAIFEGLRPRLPELKAAIYLDTWPDFIQQGDLSSPLPKVNHDSPALILFTSGSTGKPKSAVLSHAAIVNNAALAAQQLGGKAGQVWLNVLPMFHVGGSVTMLLGAISIQGTLVHMPAFDPDAMLKALADYGVDLTMAVPTMLLAMMASPSLKDTDLSALRAIVTGGTAVPPELVRTVKQCMGAQVLSLMGQTEASGTMFCNQPGDSEDQVTRSVGKPLPLSEVKIQNTENGNTNAVDVIGEICVRGPCRMSEYFEMPEKSLEAIDTDGWLHTGDLGYIRSDGRVAVTGRLKDMIIRGGENIYPREIEDELVEHADISQVAVFGLPDAQWGEQVAAAVILRPGAKLDIDALTLFLQTRIARHKIPKVWQQLESFPLNASGKIQKFLLQEQFTQKEA